MKKTRYFLAFKKETNQRKLVRFFYVKNLERKLLKIKEAFFEKLVQIRCFQVIVGNNNRKKLLKSFVSLKINCTTLKAKKSILERLFSRIIFNRIFLCFMELKANNLLKINILRKVFAFLKREKNKNKKVKEFTEKKIQNSKKFAFRNIIQAFKDQKKQIDIRLKFVKGLKKHFFQKWFFSMKIIVFFNKIDLLMCRNIKKICILKFKHQGDLKDKLEYLKIKIKLIKLYQDFKLWKINAKNSKNKKLETMKTLQIIENKINKYHLHKFLKLFKLISNFHKFIEKKKNNKMKHLFNKLLDWRSENQKNKKFERLKKSFIRLTKATKKSHSVNIIIFNQLKLIKIQNIFKQLKCEIKVIFQTRIIIRVTIDFLEVYVIQKQMKNALEKIKKYVTWKKKCIFVNKLLEFDKKSSNIKMLLGIKFLQRHCKISQKVQSALENPLKKLYLFLQVLKNKIRFKNQKTNAFLVFAIKILKKSFYSLKIYSLKRILESKRMNFILNKRAFNKFLECGRIRKQFLFCMSVNKIFKKNLHKLEKLFFNKLKYTHINYTNKLLFKKITMGKFVRAYIFTKLIQNFEVFLQKKAVQTYFCILCSF